MLMGKLFSEIIWNAFELAVGEKSDWNKYILKKFWTGINYFSLSSLS